MKKLILLFVLFSSILFSQAPTNDLVAYYPFNGNANDESGNNYHFVTGLATLTDDRFNETASAYDFNGNSDFLEHDGGFVLNSELTISTWIKPNTGTLWGMPVCIGNSSMNIRLSYDPINHKAGFSGWSSGFAGIEYSNSILSDENWYHLVGIRQGNVWKLYVNGYLDSEMNSKSYTGSNLNVAISKNAYSGYHQDYFKGKIDDVRIYNRALSEIEINELYHEGGDQNQPPNGLIAYYPLNGNANDESGNNNNGTTQGGVTWTSDRFGNSNSAALFDGIDGYIGIPNSSSLSSPTTALSVTGWVLIDPNHNIVSSLVDKAPLADAYGQYNFTYEHVNGGQFKLAFNSGYTAGFANYPLSTNTWCFVAASWNGTTVSFYVNGTKITTTNAVGPMQPDNNPISIGWQKAGFLNNHFKGKIDDLRIYNTALSDTEILELYYEGGWGQGIDESKFIFKYDFEDITNDKILDESLTSLHNGIIQGNKNFSESYCTRGMAADFNGEWRFVIENSKLENFPLTNNWTMAFSVYLTTESYGGNGFITRMSSNSGYCGNRGFYLLINSEVGGLLASFDNNYIWNAANNDRIFINGFVYDSWNRVIIVHRSTGFIDLYLNGSLFVENHKFSMDETNLKQMSIGGNYLNLMCYGTDFANSIKLDDLILYSDLIDIEKIQSDNLVNPFGFEQQGNPEDCIDTNGPPTLVVEGSYSVDEGNTVEVTAVGSDPDGDDLIYTWDLDNNGTFETLGQTVTFSAELLDGPCSQIISVKVNDGGLTAVAQTTVIINNVRPIVGPIIAPIDPIHIDYEVSTSDEFTDTGGLDLHTAVWNWGDQTTSEGSVTEENGAGTVIGVHSYLFPGVYTVTLTVTDDDGGIGESKYQYVVIYNPEGGFVTGGGWINSPEGAYLQDPTLLGKANFGFVSKYKKGQSTPDGNTQFNFKVANLNFSSTNYEWLVIAGSKAKYKGIGKINGDGDYRFMLSAIDGDKDNNPTSDKFRIKIWEKESGDLVYDNQLGDDDDGDATYEIGGGNITIHDGRGLSKDGSQSISKIIPKEYDLMQNYPNPFNPATTISYAIPIDGIVSLIIYDVLGNSVAELENGFKSAGSYSHSFDASRLTSGVYYYRLQSGSYVESKKMVLMK